MHSFIHMYADDTSFYVTGQNLNELNTLINSDLENVSRWFTLNHLVINASKTTCMLVCTQQKRVRLGNVNLNVSINESPIQNVEHQNILGITIDNCLNFSSMLTTFAKNLPNCVICSLKCKTVLHMKENMHFITQMYSHVWIIV